MSEDDDYQLEQELLQLLEETGDYERVLAELEKVSPERAVRWSIHARLALTLGDLELAQEALERAVALAPDDPGTLWSRALIAQDMWRIDEAAEVLEAILERYPEPMTLEQLAVVRDCQGRFDEADTLLAQACELAPDETVQPHRLSTEAFEEAVHSAAQELSEDFRRELERVPVLIDPMPTRPTHPAEAPEVTPDVLGLFVGASRLDAPESVSGELPPTIYLYQRNIERISPDRESLLEQIRLTLYHELGHALGFDEDGVEDMGLA